VFVGHGCGHGVGMSQHGARILAEEGWTWDQILQYFYTGVELQNFWQ
jgi:stage II sporulation protein D